MNLLSTSSLILIVVCVHETGAGDDYHRHVGRTYFQKIYNEVFNDVLPAKEGDPAPITQFILVYMDLFRSMVKSRRLEDYLDAYQVANVRFWVDASKPQITKCDPKQDEKLITRFNDHAKRVLPDGASDNRVEWRFKNLFDAVREKQYKFCEDRLKQLINGTAQSSVSYLSQFNSTPNLNQPLGDAVRMLVPRLSSALKCSSLKKCFRCTHRFKEEKVFKIYTNQIVNPCQRIMGSRELVNTLVEYIMRFESLDKVSEQVQVWNRYADWCSNFVRGNLRLTWTKVYNLLLEELKD